MTPTLPGPRRDRVLAVLAVACIALQVPGTPVASGIALAAWLAALLVLDRDALRRMGRPRFWAVTVALALATGLVLGRKDLDAGGIPLSSEGLAAGCLMVLRGALLFGVSSWAGPALARGGAAWTLRRLGLESLGESVSVALGLLPELRIRLATPAGDGTAAPGLADAARGHRLHARAVDAFCEAVRLAGELSAPPIRGPNVRIAAVVGGPGEGKTTCVLDLAARLRKAGLRTGGIAQPAIGDRRPRSGYDLLDLGDGRRRDFATAAAVPAPGRPRYAFDPDGWAWAADRIREARRSADVVIVDEIGRLEADGGGHLPALAEPLAGEKARWWLLAIRRDRLESLARRLGGFDARLDLSQGREESARAGDGLVSRMVREPGNERRDSR